MLKELTKEEIEAGRKKFDREMEELKSKIDSGEDYQMEYFDIIEDEKDKEKSNGATNK